MANKYYNAKITNPIHRSTAYDFNVQLDFNQLRQQRKGKLPQTRFAPAEQDEALDVKEHEIVFQMANSKNAFADRRLHVQSSLNNMILTDADVQTICGYANITSDALTEALSQPNRTQWSDDLKRVVEDVILSKLRYIGVAITPQANTRAHEKQSSQGFAATRGGLNTLINTGAGAIYPGDTVQVGINFDRLRYGAAPRFGEHSMANSGVPYDKCVLATNRVEHDDHFNGAALHTRILKNMLERRKTDAQRSSLGGGKKSTVAVVNIESPYHPAGESDSVVPAEVTAVVPVATVPLDGKYIDTSVLSRRDKTEVDGYMLDEDLLVPASARSALSGAQLQARFRDDYLAQEEGGDWQMSGVNIAGANVISVPLGKLQHDRHLGAVGQGAAPQLFTGDDGNDAAVGANVGQHMGERMILKVGGRDPSEMKANVRQLLQRMNTEWDRMQADSFRKSAMGESDVDLRGQHRVYARFLQHWDDQGAVAGYQDREVHANRNTHWHREGRGPTISTGFYYGNELDAARAPWDIGALDDDRIEGGPQSQYRRDKRAHYEEFLNRSRVPTVYVAWEDHVILPYNASAEGIGAITDMPTLVPGIWRVVQTAEIDQDEESSNFRLEPVQSNQLFGLSSEMAHSFIYGGAGNGRAGRGADGRDDNGVRRVRLEDAFLPYGPRGTNINPGPAAQEAIRDTLRESYENGQAHLGIGNAILQTAPSYQLDDETGEVTIHPAKVYPAGEYADRPGYAQNDGLTFLLAAMSSNDQQNVLSHTPIANLVRQTIACTMECMRSEVVKQSQRVIGIALSGAPPGQPFDICLSSVT